MRWLADENVPRTIVLWLRQQGHEVLYAAESRERASDHALLAEAQAGGSIVLTEDKDFGELVYRDRLNSHGVVLLRLEHLNARERLARVQFVWNDLLRLLPGKFLVISESRLRSRALSRECNPGSESTGQPPESGG